MCEMGRSKGGVVCHSGPSMARLTFTSAQSMDRAISCGQTIRLGDNITYEKSLKTHLVKRLEPDERSSCCLRCRPGYLDIDM